MSTSLYSSALAISTSNSERTLCCKAMSALREKSFMSTITWSLRERPVWMRLPASPHSAVSMNSTCEWTSSTPSSMRKSPLRTAAYIFFSPFSSAARSSSEISPIELSIRMWAMLPSTSASAR